MSNSPWCPLIGEECMTHRCAWYCNIQGRNPQTGANLDQWGCAITAIPMLQIEQSAAARATQAATVEVRENITNAAQAMIATTLQQQVLPAKIRIENEESNRSQIQ